MNIKAILVKAGLEPELIEFEESLENLQKYVGGYIEMVQYFDDNDVDVVINEEGKIIGLPLNKVIKCNGRVIDFIMGDLLIVGANDETGETISIPEDKISKYMNIFSNDLIEI